MLLVGVCVQPPQSRRDLLGMRSLHRLLPLARHGLMPWYRLHPAYPAEQYDRVPLGAVAALVALARRAKRAATRLGVPYTVVHGTADQVADFAAAAALARHSPQGRLVTLAGANHDVLRTNTAHSWAHIIQAVAACGVGGASGQPHKPNVKESPRNDLAAPTFA